MRVFIFMVLAFLSSATFAQLQMDVTFQSGINLNKIDFDASNQLRPEMNNNLPIRIGGEVEYLFFQRLGIAFSPGLEFTKYAISYVDLDKYIEYSNEFTTVYRQYDGKHRIFENHNILKVQLPIYFKYNLIRKVFIGFGGGFETFLNGEWKFETDPFTVLLVSGSIGNKVGWNINFNKYLQRKQFDIIEGTDVLIFPPIGVPFYQGSILFGLSYRLI